MAGNNYASFRFVAVFALVDFNHSLIYGFQYAAWVPTVPKLPQMYKSESKGTSKWDNTGFLSELFLYTTVNWRIRDEIRQNLQKTHCMQVILYSVVESLHHSYRDTLW